MTPGLMLLAAAVATVGACAAPSASGPAPTPAPTSGPDTISDPTTEEATVSATAPALPDDALLQYAIPERGIMHRVTLDGAYLVTTPARTDQATQPTSRFEPGIDRLSEAGLERLREALEEIGFFDLPAEVEGPDLAGAVTTAGAPLADLRLVFSARGPSGVHTVTVRGDPDAPATMGPLEPLYTALDHEAMGDWLRE